MQRPAVACAQERVNGGPNPLGGRFDVLISDMRVAQRHCRVAVAKQPSDDGNRYAVQVPPG